MKNPFLRRNHRMATTVGLALGVFVLTSCRPSAPPGWQGYLEAEFVYIGAPLGGQLESLAVEKGSRVTAGTVLFTLERGAELATQLQAMAQLSGALARVEDLKKGARPTEVAGLEAQVAQARVTAELARIEFERIASLHKTNVVAESEFDRTRLTDERAARTLDQLLAQLATARIGGRDDAIAAAKAEARAAAAAKERADWSVAQKSQAASREGWIYDTLFRSGEFVPAGTPVVALLAPELLKARFFVTEAEFATLQAGEAVWVSITGRAEPLAARISYLSPMPEYTPPVLYNRDNRAKLVFMVEATFATADAQNLHPGQPVDVTRSRPAP